MHPQYFDTKISEDGLKWAKMNGKYMFRYFELPGPIWVSVSAQKAFIQHYTVPDVYHP